MSDAREILKGRIQGLTEELNLMTAHSWNRATMNARRQEIIKLQMELNRIECTYKTFDDYRRILVTRHRHFVQAEMRKP